MELISKTTVYKVIEKKRYLVTEFTESTLQFAGGETSTEKSSRVVGNFESPIMAEQVRLALQAFAADESGKSNYAIIKLTFEPDTQVFYAETFDQAEVLAHTLASADGSDWRITKIHFNPSQASREDQERLVHEE